MREHGIRNVLSAQLKNESSLFVFFLILNEIVNCAIITTMQYKLQTCLSVKLRAQHSGLVNRGVIVL